MRQVILDTETTGLDPAEGDRVIEIGCVELIDRKITGKTWQSYMNPDGRESHPMALRVHGLTTEFLADKPRFIDVIKDLDDFLGSDEIVAHNAPFDVKFLNAELERVGFMPMSNSIVDTLKLPQAAGLRIGGSLNILADRYKISREARADKHGALVDAQLLALVYLAMTQHQQELDMEQETEDAAMQLAARPADLVIPVIRPSVDELAAHRERMLEIKHRKVEI